jgi:hypothetical protein
MNFTIRAFVGETRVATAISYSKDKKNHLQQVFPEKKMFGSLRGWMMHYTKKNAATSFKMEPSATPKPVLPDNPTQAIVRKFYNGFGLENTLTPRSQGRSTTSLYVFTSGGFHPIYFNRQTGLCKIGLTNNMNELPDISNCKFFIKNGHESFKAVTVPEIVEPKSGQPVIAYKHNYSAFSYSQYDNQMKKAFTDAGYFVKDFYLPNYKNEKEMMNVIFTTPGIRGAFHSSYWFSSQDIYFYTSATTGSSMKLNEWLAANPITSAPTTANTSATVQAYPPLPPSPAPVAAV